MSTDSAGHVYLGWEWGPHNQGKCDQQGERSIRKAWSRERLLERDGQSMLSMLQRLRGFNIEKNGSEGIVIRSLGAFKLA